MENTRSSSGRTHETTTSSPHHVLDWETLSDEEIESLLFEDEQPGKANPWNVSTVAGLSLIFVGVLYLLQELGLWSGVDISLLAHMLPWVAGVFIILLGFGVLSRHPSRSSTPAPAEPSPETNTAREEAADESSGGRFEGRLTKSATDKKIAGVCAGIAEYLDLDPTLVRIAFVFGTIISGGPPFIAAYLALIYVLPTPEPPLPSPSPSSPSRRTV